MRKATLILFTLIAGCIGLMAQEADSTSLRPSFGVDYTGEVQTDFERFRQANLLQLSAGIPFSRALSFQVSTITAWTTRPYLEVNDLQVFSNIDVYALRVPFTLSVAGFSWQMNDRHSLFAGIRRIDEDYFCSDALGLFTNSSCGIFPTLSWNYYVATYPFAAMGIHYAYDHKNIRLQASLYNGDSDYHFTGRYNMFRICPQSDGIFALGQVEYRHRDSHYYLGGSLNTEPETSPAMWAYAEQALTSNLTMILAYSHAFGDNLYCNDFCGIGARYTYKRAEFGIFTDFTSVTDIEEDPSDEIDEFATEFVCNLRLTDYLSVKPVLHIITTDDETKYVGMLRVMLSF